MGVVNSVGREGEAGCPARWPSQGLPQPCSQGEGKHAQSHFPAFPLDTWWMVPGTACLQFAAEGPWLRMGKVCLFPWLTGSQLTLS